MNYSAAIVFDSAGRVADVPATLNGGLLRLTVPESFLAHAEGAIVVDPILNTFSVDTATGDQRDGDVAYDRTTDSFTYVYVDTFSMADVDIYRTTVDLNGLFLSSEYIDSSSEEWGGPSIANLNFGDAHLTVTTRINGTTGFSEIVGRVTDVQAGTAGPVLLIGYANVGWENFRPDVGGNGSSSSGSWFVVWERRFSATQTLSRGALVSATGSVGSFVQITPGGSNIRQEEVVISKSTGDPSTVNVWNVAMRQQDLGTDTDTIIGVQLNATGSLVNPASTLYTDQNNSRLREIDISDAIDVDSLAFPTYLVTFDDYSSVTEDAELLVCRDNQLFRSERSRSTNANTRPRHVTRPSCTSRATRWPRRSSTATATRTARATAASSRSMAIVRRPPARR